MKGPFTLALILAAFFAFVVLLSKFGMLAI